MSATLILVRHGQTDWNVIGRYMGWTDEDLNEEGRAQAERVAGRLEGWPIVAVYSSPLRRAVRTAEAIAKRRSVPVETIEELGEMRIGAWEGMYAGDIAARFPQPWKIWRTNPGDFRMPDGESLGEVWERAVKAFDKIMDRSEGRMAVAVTHDVVVRLLAAHVLGVGVDIYRRVEVGNASVTVLERDGVKLRLRLLNDTGHLER